MKVIHIMDNLGNGGGVNSFVFDLCHALKEQNVDVSLIGILNCDYSLEVKKLQKMGVKVICIGSSDKKRAILYDIPKLRRTIKEIAEDASTICNLHLKLSVLMGTVATAGLKHVRCVETYHSLYSHYWLQNRILAPFIKKYIACSKSAKDEMQRRFHLRESKLCYISNGVNRQELRKSVRDQKTAGDDFIRAVSVGRLTDQKNFHITAEAFSVFAMDRFIYQIYGDGPKKDQIIQASGGSLGVRLCEMVTRDQIMEILNQASIVVMPSLWEGLSIFMLEAMAFDNPMMISDVPSLRDVFHEKGLAKNEHWRCCSWGYLVETDNIKAYREAMEHFINNLENRKRMQDAVRSISFEYDIYSTSEKYIREYQEVMK